MGETQQPKWSKQWTLGSDTDERVGTATVALSGPEIGGGAPIEVVPKDEAERRVADAGGADVAEGYEDVAMQLALHSNRATDGVEAINNLRDAVIWLAAETRTARVAQEGQRE